MVFESESLTDLELSWPPVTPDTWITGVPHHMGPEVETQASPFFSIPYDFSVTLAATHCWLTRW